MPTPSYQIKNLDHLGLVAGMCQELEIAEMIDAHKKISYLVK